MIIITNIIINNSLTHTQACIDLIIMRRRRGAIHSNDEEEYIKLSILSEKSMGIFYNETLTDITQPPPTQSKWEDFDFNADNRMKNEEMQEEQTQSGKVVTVNVMILMSQDQSVPLRVKASLSEAFQLPTLTQEKLPLELIIKEEQRAGNNLVIKFWLSSLEFQKMLESYYKMAETLIVVSTEPDSAKVESTLNLMRQLKSARPFQLRTVRVEEWDLDSQFKELRHNLLQRLQ